VHENIVQQTFLIIDWCNRVLKLANSYLALGEGHPLPPDMRRWLRQTILHDTMKEAQAPASSIIAAGRQLMLTGRQLLFQTCVSNFHRLTVQ
jgi:hypothetical protein